MHDLTDIKIWLSALLQPIVYEAVRAANQPTTIISQSEPDELLTPKETAQLLKVSTVTIWDWEKRGILNARRIGNQVRYLRSEVIAAARPKKGGSSV